MWARVLTIIPSLWVPLAYCQRDSYLARTFSAACVLNSDTRKTRHKTDTTSTLITHSSTATILIKLTGFLKFVSLALKRVQNFWLFRVSLDQNSYLLVLLYSSSCKYEESLVKLVTCKGEAQHWPWHSPLMHTGVCGGHSTDRFTILP